MGLETKLKEIYEELKLLLYLHYNFPVTKMDKRKNSLRYYT